MSHYSVADRPIISSVTRRLVFLIKSREILDLAVELKVKACLHDAILRARYLPMYCVQHLARYPTRCNVAQ